MVRNIFLLLRLVKVKSAIQMWPNNLGQHLLACVEVLVFAVRHWQSYSGDTDKNVELYYSLNTDGLLMPRSIMGKKPISNKHTELIQ